MRSFFLGWDRGRLSQIYAPFMTSGNPDYEICDDFRRLHWNGRVQRLPSSPATETQQPTGAARRWVGALKHFRFVQRAGTPLRNWWLGRSRYAQGLQDELQSIRPDVVYAFLNNMPVTKATALACEGLDIPLCVYIGDDFVKGFRKNNAPSARRQPSAEYWLQRAVDHATGHMAVGPHMAKEYSRRYGGDWKWFAALAEADDYDPAPRCNTADKPIRIVYAGNLTFNRWEMLRRLGLALKQLHDEGIRSELSIYSSPAQVELYRNKLNIPPVVTLQGWVPPQQLPRIFHDADILVHCESFADEEVSEAIKWSLSTKISQYMMAGRCILAIGPAKLASIKFVKENDAGIVIETQDARVLLESLRGALKDREKIARTGQVGREKAMELFEGKVQREKFRQVLADAIDKHRESSKTPTDIHKPG